MDTTLTYNICVIDILAAYDNQKKYVIKELAAFRMGGCQSWFFQKPLNLSDALVVHSNFYLERHFHGIPVEYGDLPYDSLNDVLRSVTCNVRYVFCKGEEKCNFLKERLPELIVIDLNLLRCAKHFNPTLTCMFHFDKLDKECAFRNCLSNAAWLSKFIAFEQKRVAFMKLNCPLSTATTIEDTSFLPFTTQEYLCPYISCEDRIKSYRCPRNLDVQRFWRDVIGNEAAAAEVKSWT